jgi:hypothetical protein
VWIKVANIVRIRFVIQITIYIFVLAEKLAILALRHQLLSDPEEELKVKSSS